MSASPYFYIELYNAKEDKWEDVTVYIKNKDKFVPVPVWMWNGTHELFSMLEAEHSYEDNSFDKVHYGLPKNASDIVKESYERYDEYKPDVRWINLADALLYLHDHAKVKDIDAMEEYWANANDVKWDDVPEQFKDNPIKGLTNRVYEYLNVWDDAWAWNRSESDVRIIYWLSW